MKPRCGYTQRKADRQFPARFQQTQRKRRRRATETSVNIPPPNKAMLAGSGVLPTLPPVVTTIVSTSTSVLPCGCQGIQILAQLKAVPPVSSVREPIGIVSLA